MRPSAVLTAVLAIAPSVYAVGVTKSAIVWFEGANTPEHIIDEARDAIVAAGGKITHVYNTVMKGFAVVAPEHAFETAFKNPDDAQIKVWTKDYGMKVEEDEVMSINNE